MIHFKVQEKPKKKSVLLTRDKFVWRLVGNQRTAPGCIEGKPPSKVQSNLNLILNPCYRAALSLCSRAIE